MSERQSVNFMLKSDVHGKTIDIDFDNTSGFLTITWLCPICKTPRKRCIFIECDFVSKHLHSIEENES